MKRSAVTLTDPSPDDTIDVTPIMKAFKSRATAAATLWAHENPELVEQHRENNTIGDWKHTVGKLFKQLPQEERDKWEAKKEERKARQSTLAEDWFECVHS